MSDEKLWNALNQPGIVKLQDMLESTRCIGIVNLSEAIEVPPLTEAITAVAMDVLSYGSGFMRDGKHVPYADVYVKPVDVDAERAAFEALMREVGHDCERFEEGEKDYVDEAVELAWMCVLWRASRG